MTVYITDKLVALDCPALILEREENRSTRRKTLEAQKRSTAGILTREIPRTRHGFSGERHNELTACATGCDFLLLNTHYYSKNIEILDKIT